MYIPMLGVTAGGARAPVPPRLNPPLTLLGYTGLSQDSYLQFICRLFLS